MSDDDDRIAVMFFCLGNICRSPIAEALFRHKLADQGLGDRFLVRSSGTGAYHVGEGADPGSCRVCAQRLGDDLSGHRAQQLTAEHLERFDYLVAMDTSNIENARRLRGGQQAELLLLRDFEPRESQRGLGVPDPWGGGAGGFDEVYDIVDRCLDNLLDHIRERESL